MEEKVMYGVLTVYRERGYYLRRLEQFEKAKLSYDEALKYFPEDLRLLIGRSQVCADAVKPREAYENAEKALKIEPSNMQARNVQAQALNTLSDFERSLVMNYRGSWRRRQPPYFFEGINQGLEILEDCLGKNAGPVMINFLPIIKANISDIPDEHEPQMKKRVSRIPQPENKKIQTQMEIRKQLLLSRVLAMKYLGAMAYDKFFLKELSGDRRLHSANEKGAAELKALVGEALRSLTERQDMLRTQRPYYCIRWAERSESSRQTKFKKELLKRECEINYRTADRLLKSVEQAMRQRKMMILIARSERFQKFLDMKTPRNLPDRNVFLDRLYKAVGEGYLTMHRLSYKLSEQGNRRRIAFLMGLPCGRPKSYDSVRATYAYKFIDLKDATEAAMLTLETCENAWQRCWLQYEIACLLNKQKNYALAKFYAKRCQRGAQEIQSVSWWLNGCFALMCGDMQQGNSNDVRVEVEEAYVYAKKMQDPEQVQAFLLKCLEVANEPIVADEHKAVVKRQNEILKVMMEPTKVETAVLFKRISTVPPGRQFKVLPSKPIVNMNAERKRRRHLGISVIPGKEKGLPPMPKSKVAGFQYFDVGKGGK